MRIEKSIHIHLQVSEDVSPETRRALLAMATAAIKNYAVSMNENFDANIQATIEENQ
jgi:hypothetical protein